MSVKKIASMATVVILTSILSACGGGSSDSSGENNNDNLFKTLANGNQYRCPSSTALASCADDTSCGIAKCYSVKVVTPSGYEEVNRTLIVYYEADFDKTLLKQIVQKYQANVKYDYDASNGQSIVFPVGTDIESVMAEIKALKGVTSVYKSIIVSTAS